jgi:hypothetical protein
LVWKMGDAQGFVFHQWWERELQDMQCEWLT